MVFLSEFNVVLKLFVICVSAKSIKALGISNILPQTDYLKELTELPKLLKTVPVPPIDKPSDAKLFATEYDSGINNEDKYLNFTQLANKYGYNVRVYEVQTEDQYILTIFRIGNMDGPPVLLVHGLFCSADELITPGPESSIAYLLADQGYDVWLANTRGTKYSRRHVFLSPDDNAARFWNFGFHEVGRSDLPVIIDHILNTTGKTKLKYVGHAQGATVFYVMCSELPEYNKKVSLMIGLSTIAWFSNTTSPFIRALTVSSPVIDTTTQLIGQYEFTPNNQFVSLIRDALCGSELLASTICTHFVFLIAGIDYGQVNYTNMNVMLSHIPAPCSTKQVLHYTQLVKSERFQKYDYGHIKNKAVYNGSEIPPEYDVHKVTAPVALFYGDGDWLVTLPDITILRKKLPKVVDFYTVPFKNFNHVDFIWGIDTKTLIVSRMLQLFEKFQD